MFLQNFLNRILIVIKLTLTIIIILQLYLSYQFPIYFGKVYRCLYKIVKNAGNTTKNYLI